MTDIVIPYRPTRSTDELRYCLRSIEKHLSGVGKVFIIGECPEWVKGVLYIPVTDNPDSRWKERNVFNKLMIACNSPQVSDSFLCVHDDHLLLADYKVDEFPYYYSTINGGNEVYRRQVENTGKFEKYFDIHCPIILHKTIFKYAFENWDWSKPYGYLIKTIYCRYAGVEGIPMEDCKIRIPGEHPAPDRKWFSTSDKVLNNGMITYLKNLYPNPSKYEA